MNKGKKQILLEFELNANSPSIIWPLISEATGLERWMADTVERNGNKLLFTWGTSWQNKDERSATILEEVKDKLIKYCESGKVCPLVIGGHKIGGGKWTVDSIDANFKEVWNRGELVSVEIAVTATEYY